MVTDLITRKINQRNLSTDNNGLEFLVMENLICAIDEAFKIFQTLTESFLKNAGSALGGKNMNQTQLNRMKDGLGFIAALDQSGGSSPKALARYGIKEDSWKDEDEMFDLMHAMRTRMIKSPSFNADRILAAILLSRQWIEPLMDYILQTISGKRKELFPF